MDKIVKIWEKYKNFGNVQELTLAHHLKLSEFKKEDVTPLGELNVVRLFWKLREYQKYSQVSKIK